MLFLDLYSFMQNLQTKGWEVEVGLSRKCLLRHIYLPVIHEVEHRHQVDILDTFEVEEGVGVWVLFQDTAKEGAAGREYNFVSLHLLVVAGEGHIKEVFVFSQLPECDADV